MNLKNYIKTLLNSPALPQPIISHQLNCNSLEQILKVPPVLKLKNPFLIFYEI